ncbi:hypothetical protein AX17_000870 [Amanita inopinata Kibby_2008]|nr:hypothetical protein AX17_000870 [Amanita inopinata Kibby_2008]
MLVLSSLHHLLSQVLTLPRLHTAVLLTPAGELVSFASDPAKPKDDIRVLVGLSSEIWQETRDHGFGMADSELGRIVVIPVDEAVVKDVSPHRSATTPMLLIALNAIEDVEWEELHTKGKELAGLLGKSLGKYQETLAVKSIPSTAAPTPIIMGPMASFR